MVLAQLMSHEPLSAGRPRWRVARRAVEVLWHACGVIGGRLMCRGGSGLRRDPAVTAELAALPPVPQAFTASVFTWALTALGAAAVFITREWSRRLLDGMLGFAAGVMIAPRSVSGTDSDQGDSVRRCGSMAQPITRRLQRVRW